MYYNRKGGFMKRIILASKSKRRIEYMKELGFKFEIIESTKPEFVDSYKSNEDSVISLARQKALDVYSNNKDALVLGFDTLVFLDGDIIGKPQTKEECIEILKKLRGKTHKVITGAYFISSDFEKSFSSSCLVTFSHIDDDEIENYSNTIEPYDKAGGYAIQGYIGRFIKEINGDFFSVVGMPKAEVYLTLKEYIKNH